MSDGSVSTPTFEIGLVLAGAVSGGAYTAGVLDFLFEALDAFEAAKKSGDPGCPRHAVRIRTMTGASAGAMCVGLGLQSLLRRGASVSPLHDAWVRRISARALLETHDLPDDQGTEPRVISLLDSSVLDQVAEATLPLPVEGDLPGYVSDALSLGMCTAQLRGVPYSVPLVGSGAYGMRLHAVERWFEVDVPAWRTHPPDPDWWCEMRKTCIASGAFPIGLAPRLLDLPRQVYDQREWPTTGPNGDGTVPLTPDWPKDGTSAYSSYHVDGGLFNNEPLELAREKLSISGNPKVRNPRDGDKATRALLMVDPFLELDVDCAPQRAPGVLGLVPDLVNAMIQNARFKPAELVLAVDETIYSRFLIAPRRATEAGIDRYALASGVLGAFGGFLSEAFREHDYQLGRRNCQQFLRRSFALYATNDIVSGWGKEAIRDHAFSHPEVQKDGTTMERSFRPLVPLYGTARKEVQLPKWPRWGEPDRAALRAGLAHRATAVVNALVAEHARNPLVRFGLETAWKALGWAGRARIGEMVEKALVDRRLA